MPQNRTQLDAQIARWLEAGLIDQPAAARIRAFEAGQERRGSLRWPVLIAMIFGGVLLAAGITLFVAAHWDNLSPSARFSLLLLMVAVFHVAGALAGPRFRALSITMHGVGTVVLGAAIFLAAQIFNLRENWPSGVLLWAVGAALGFLLLRDWLQAALLALLAPAWLISQWMVTAEPFNGSWVQIGFFVSLTAISYLSARIGDHPSVLRRALVWIGGLAVIPAVVTAIGMADTEKMWIIPSRPLMSIAAWTVAVVAPLAFAWWLRGREAWINLLWAAWLGALVWSAKYWALRYLEPNALYRSFELMAPTLLLYALCAVGSVGLVAWGLRERRKERLNLGIVSFALTVILFYFDPFMNKLGRSASLMILGVLCVVGGYFLEVTRRRLVARMEAAP